MKTKRRLARENARLRAEVKRLAAFRDAVFATLDADSAEGFDCDANPDAPAEELPRNRGMTSGFDVFDADADGVSVAYYGAYDYRSRDPKSVWHARYADLLAEHYTVEWRVGSLRVTVKR